MTANILKLSSALLIGATSLQSQQTWSTKAKVDLQAIHDIILSDHPGPVDPQNPGYKRWLEKGLVVALSRVQGVKTQADYFRVVGAYTQGFRDNHLAVEPNHLHYMWPGFLTNIEAGKVVLAVKDASVSVPEGAVLMSCDGIPANALMERLVYSYRINPAVPQTKRLAAPRLFTVVQGDEKAPQSCVFATGSTQVTTLLHYKPFDTSDMYNWIDKTEGSIIPPLQVRQISDVWIISIPTFDWYGSGASKVEDFINRLATLSTELHAAKNVVIDVRGNGGGNGEWADRVVACLFGRAAQDEVRRSFDETVEWRASPDNERELQRIAKWETASGLDGAEVARVADGVTTALAQHQNFYRQAAPATYKIPTGGQPSPFKGRVYLLTDNACASACLGFADTLLRFRNVVHVGLPTNADAIYIDITHAPLPSQAANLRYSLKVYRNRSRGNNEWLTPRIVWPGGPMTDERVAAWVTELSSGAGGKIGG